MRQFFRKLKEANLRWVFVALALNGFGLVALYSIGSDAEELSMNSRFFKHLLWLVPASGAFIFFLAIPVRVIHKYAYAAFGLVLGLLFVPHLTGPVAGTYRWISFGGVGFQPSEIMKWVLVIALARYLSDHNLKIKSIRSVIVPILITLIPAVVIMRQPDLGSAIIVVAPIISLLYWVGARSFHIFILVAPILTMITAFNFYTFTFWIVLVAVILYLSNTTFRAKLSNFFVNIFIGLLTPVLWGQLKSYQQERFLVLLDVSRDPRGAAYQVIQSQTAIGSGGFFGKGWGRGTQTHLKFLPEQETDFIFSVIGEELGFIAVCLILLLFALLILDLIRAAYVSSERFSSLILIGIATLFLTHMFVNVGMTINLLPVKGLPLPFLSYGGSFLVSCYAMIGLAMNVSVEALE
ncbi:MAG: rod shape-determining protein RodA [Candidatus Neomarinimicrobiota bacterium]